MMNTDYWIVAAFLILFAVMAIVVFGGCATVTTECSETLADGGTTTLTTRVLTFGTAKIDDAQPDAEYTGPDWIMSTGATATGTQSDVTALVSLLSELLKALVAAQTPATISP
jgi:hypothetical protein